MKLKPCPVCGKLFRATSAGSPTAIGFANHLAMHRREEAKAEINGWDDRNPFKARHATTHKQESEALKAQKK